MMKLVYAEAEHKDEMAARRNLTIPPVMLLPMNTLYWGQLVSHPQAFSELLKLKKQSLAGLLCALPPAGISQHSPCNPQDCLQVYNADVDCKEASSSHQHGLLTALVFLND